jgi:hypothetical protein
VTPADPVALDFRLRTPVRVSWTSTEARDLWEPRLQAIRDALDDTVSWGATLTAVRLHRLHTVRGAALRRGWALRKLDRGIGFEEQHFDARGVAMVLVGALDRVEDAAAALVRRDAASLAAATGLPACCIAAAWRETGLDPIWDRIRACGDGLFIELPALPETNPLLRPLGLSVAPIPPCDVRCAAMQAAVRAQIDRLAQSAYREPMGWLAEALDWPIRWSALHGIVETLTPVLRFTYGTRGTGRRIGVRYLGTTTPEASARGLAFPYRQPARLRTGS